MPCSYDDPDYEHPNLTFNPYQHTPLKPNQRREIENQHLTQIQQQVMPQEIRKELDERNNMNVSEAHYPPRTYSPNVMNGGPYRGDNSPYSSHMSVQSNHSNPPWDPRNGHPKNPGYTHDPVIAHDNYAPYPAHRMASPNSRMDQPTPTRDVYSVGPHGDRGTPTLPYYNHNPGLNNNNSPYRESPNSFPTRDINPAPEPYYPPGDTDSYQGNRYPDNADPYRSVEPERNLEPYEGPPYMDGDDPYRQPIDQPERSLDAHNTRPPYMDDGYRSSPLPAYTHADMGEPYPSEAPEPYFNTSLPPVDSDPFRDDPFHRGGPPSPRVIEGPQYGDDDISYTHQPPSHQPSYHDDMPYTQQPQSHQPSFHDNSYHDDYSPQRSDEIDGSRLRNPDLQEVIEYLTNQNDEIKANAAAYLTHLSYMDNDMKAKIRAMNGIRALVGLLGNEFPEVCRNACCALKNLSYGQANSENKLAIRNENGVAHLVRVLRKTDDPEVVDLVTAILWNMSSLQEVKMSIIDDALTMLVTLILVKYAGWERHKERPSTDISSIRWTTALRNTTGILRNLSSGDHQARKRLRECEPLIPCIVHLVRLALQQHTADTDSNAIDNKCVENCVCVMRNLSYLCQESEQPDFMAYRPNPTTTTTSTTKTASPAKYARTGCFGGRRKDSPKLNRNDEHSHSKRMSHTPLDMSQLWHCTVVPIYKQLLMDSSNSVTLEAAVGAIQNVAACYWQPSHDFREAVRREKCLPIIVELLAVDSEPVVCAAITALRNLTVDDRNMELIGKYAMQALVSKLPLQVTRTLPRDQVVQATLTTLLEVIKKNSNYAISVLNEKGVERLRFITDSPFIYLEKTILLAKKVLETLWGIPELQSQYKTMDLRPEHFTVTRIQPRLPTQPMPTPQGQHPPPQDNYGTLSHPASGRGYDDNTLTPARTVQSHRLTEGDDQPPFMGYTNPAHNPDPEMYSYGSPNRPVRDTPRNVHEMTTYTTVDHNQPRHKVPVGGVALFPTSQPNIEFREPVYAKVNKNKGQVPGYDDAVHDLSHLRLNEEDTAVTNADSWV